MAVTRWRTPARAAGLALVAIALAFPASAFANTNEPIAQTGGMTVTIPMLGTSLKVAVTLDVVGNISGVTLTPADALPTSTTDEHGVKFSNADGTATVKVKAKGDKLQIKATTKLADLVGSGTWEANVFGAGTGANVAYTIAIDADGKPTLTIDSATAAAGIGVVIKDPTTDHAGKHDDNGKHNGWARASVVFSLNGFSKTLTLKVSARDDGTASLKITLSGRDRQKLQGTLLELAGARVWSAHLCDGTPVSVAYHVTAAGTAVVDATDPTTGTVKTNEHGFRVRFDGTKVGLSVRLKALEGDIWALKVSGQSGRCGGGHDEDGHDGHDKSSRDGNGAGTAAAAAFRSGQNGRGNGGRGEGGGHDRGDDDGGGHGGGDGH